MRRTCTGKAADGTGEAERLTKGSQVAIRQFDVPRQQACCVSGEISKSRGRFRFDGHLHSTAIAHRDRWWPRRPVSSMARISPDGRWMAYESSESGRASKVYVGRGHPWLTVKLAKYLAN